MPPWHGVLGTLLFGRAGFGGTLLIWWGSRLEGISLGSFFMEDVCSGLVLRGFRCKSVGDGRHRQRFGRGPIFRSDKSLPVLRLPGIGLSGHLAAKRRDGNLMAFALVSDHGFADVQEASRAANRPGLVDRLSIVLG